MIKWIRNKYHCRKHGHDWTFVEDVPHGISVLFGNTYCECCGKTMYRP